MVITRWSILNYIEYWLIIFFGAKDGEAVYSQQKQGLNLTVAQIISKIQKTTENQEKQ